MTKFSNVVRFIARNDQRDALIRAFKDSPHYDGLISQTLIQTGEDTFCAYGIWNDEESLVNAREEMISFLDSIRPMLEEISSELGVTDPVSGPVIVEK